MRYDVYVKVRADHLIRFVVPMPNAKRDTKNTNQQRANVAPRGSSIGSQQGYLGADGSTLAPDGDDLSQAEHVFRSASDVVARPTSDMPNAPSGIFQVAQKHESQVMLAAAAEADATRDRALFAAAMGDALDAILRSEPG